MGRPEGPTTPTQLSLKLPKGVSPVGDWQAPKPDRFYSGAGESRGYMGEAKFTHELAIENEQAAGQVEIGCEVLYQACNDRMCDRETKTTVSAKLDIIDEKSR
jgi:DsbC/DsbD-like thiol-disulfide interchange protein